MPDLYKNSFKSKIGTIYYIWMKKGHGYIVPGPAPEHETDIKPGPAPAGQVAGPEPAPLSGAVLVFLGNNRKSFEKYMERLSRKFAGARFKEKRAAFMEKSVLAYLEGKVKGINASFIFLTGNDFEKKVWYATAGIPYGQIASYREIAEKAGYPGAWRAAGTALGNNPIMLVIPCHRVIKSSGEIGKYGGGENIKRALLDFEYNQATGH